MCTNKCTDKPISIYKAQLDKIDQWTEVCTDIYVLTLWPNWDCEKRTACTLDYRRVGYSYNVYMIQTGIILEPWLRLHRQRRYGSTTFMCKRFTLRQNEVWPSSCMHKICDSLEPRMHKMEVMTKEQPCLYMNMRVISNTSPCTWSNEVLLGYSDVRFHIFTSVKAGREKGFPHVYIYI